MVACTYNCFLNVINIGNSIIGVSILAMPYCFSKCGILLSIILIIISGLLTKLACFLLLKSAVIARRRSFEFLAFHMLGPYGKLLVEMSVIGFLIGVCIAFFVVIGDLGPPLAAEFLNIEKAANLRTDVLVFVGLCVALPLGLLRKIDSLTSLSVLSIAFYVCLILKIFAEAVPNLAYNEWWYSVNWWRSEGILPCLPIFSMALSCQTQIFEFFDTANDPSIKRMQSVIDGAVCLCSVVYLMVGTFGYIAFHDKNISGNILVLLTPSAITEIIKLGFILTVAVSFPLCLFPCRSSLHSLLFKQGFVHHDVTVNNIPDHRFRILTVSLVIVTIGIAIMLPNIEFVLGMIGSTIGTFICLILPAIIFIKHSNKMMFEISKAHVLLSVGIFIMIACTFSTLQENRSRPEDVHENPSIKKVTPVPFLLMNSVIPDTIPSPKTNLKETPSIKAEKKVEADSHNLVHDQKRLEPPVPQEPDVKVEQNSDLDPQALKKEDKELQKETVPNSSGPPKKVDGLVKQEILLKKLEEQHEEQKLILEEQKKVLQELKQHKESHELIEKQEAEKKKTATESEKLNELHKEQQLVLKKSEKILQELKKQKETLENQSPVAQRKENFKLVPPVRPKDFNNIEENVENLLPKKSLEKKNEDVLDKKVGLSNISIIVESKQKVKNLQENKQSMTTKQFFPIQENSENNEMEEFVQPNKKNMNILNGTVIEIKSKTYNQSFSDSNLKSVSEIANRPFSVEKKLIKDSPSKSDSGLLVKRRETLAKKLDFEVTVVLPTYSANLNLLNGKGKNET